MRVYRWDLDKTYLETDIHSVRGLLRAAVEPARQKRAVPGAPALLRELAREKPGWRPRIFILSGSPTQMRTVLEAKLQLDGVRFDEFILKDNLGNLKRGRLRAMRGQFGYKLPKLLTARVGLGPAVREVLFGDDAEVDALVYSVYADAIAGRVAPVEVSRVLHAAGAYPDHIVDALSALRRVGQAEAVDRIYIRLDRGRPVETFAPLGNRVVPVHSWFQAALGLYGTDLDAVGVARVLDASALSDTRAVDLFEESLAGGFVDPARMEALFAEVEPRHVWDRCGAVLARGGWAWASPKAPEGIDYVAALRAFTR